MQLFRLKKIGLFNGRYTKTKCISNPAVPLNTVIKQLQLSNTEEVTPKTEKPNS